MQASDSTKQKRSRPSALFSARTTPLRVLFVTSEVEPFRKSGGLGDVAGSLPKALKRRGIDVRVVMPLYRGIRLSELERLEGVLEVPMYYGTGADEGCQSRQMTCGSLTAPPALPYTTSSSIT